ncbi:MAG: hypothetical protein EOM20_12430 [Spartobacteria bacterium]|nr:hypothetical protein [Spartobacteria bacterium]
MKTNTYLGILVAGMMVASSVDTWALWGKTKTATTDGNEQMNLGEYKGLKHAIGCKEFENEAGWHGSWNLGDNLTIMLESALFDTGRFVLVEREKLDDVFAEQDLQASGRMAKSKDVAQTGMARSAKYIATGAVTEVEESQSGGSGGISFKGISVGGGKSDAHIAIIAKLIDTTTGEIVAKQRIEGKADNASMKVGLSKWGLNTDMGGFKKTPLGEAAQDCINQAAIYFAKQMEEFPFEGSVVKATSKGVIINRGSQFGLEPGQILVMTEEGEVLLDPDTGEILDKEEGEEIGKLEVKTVKEKISYCDVIEGEEEPAPGTVVMAE